MILLTLPGTHPTRIQLTCAPARTIRYRLVEVYQYLHAGRTMSVLHSVIKKASFRLTPNQVRRITLGQVKRNTSDLDNNQSGTEQSPTNEVPAVNQFFRIRRVEPSPYREILKKDIAFKTVKVNSNMTEMQKIHTDKAFPGMLLSHDTSFISGDWNKADNKCVVSRRTLRTFLPSPPTLNTPHRRTHWTNWTHRAKPL